MSQDDRSRPGLLRRLLRLALTLGVFALVGTLAMALWSRRAVEVGLADGALRPCAVPTNCVCSQGAEAAIEPLPLVGGAAGAIERVRRLVDGMEGAEWVSADERYAHVVFATPLLGFRDDVEFLVDEDAGVVHVRSASRVGRSDLGANAARVGELRAAWDALAD